jgi:Gluconate kinase
MKTYAFIGPSGTGKSHRAQFVAEENGTEYIIDDGLFIKGNKVIAGISAKRAPTKIETVRQALFSQPEKQAEIKKAVEEYRPEIVLILGTSDNMVDKITENLGFPPISKRIYINEIATEGEMETAKTIRRTEGKHVIPVPTFEIKKDFSGFFLDPLQVFKWKGKGTPYVDEKSIIRPTFSYLGNYKISDSVFRNIVEYQAEKAEAIYKVLKTRVSKYEEGVHVYMEVAIIYGFNVIDALKKFKEKCRKDIERLTAMNVYDVEIVAKSIQVVEEGKVE